MPLKSKAIVGDTPNLAARCRALRSRTALVVAESTCKLVGSLFELEDLGPQELKGISWLVRAWRHWTGLYGRPFRSHAYERSDQLLSGGKRNSTYCCGGGRRPKSGLGQVVLLSGEPGIGKSRLTAALLEHLANEPHTRLRYFCSPHHQDSALHPSIAQLERAAGFRREDTPEQRLAKLEAVLAQGVDDLTKVVPLMADLLSIPTGDRYPPLNLTPQKRKERTLHALLDHVEGLAARQPVLMVFEDVHWSDPTTREGLDLIVDQVPTLRVLVILTFRPEFTAPWVGRPHVTMVNLNRLPVRQRAEMIDPRDWRQGATQGDRGADR